MDCRVGLDYQAGMDFELIAEKNLDIESAIVARGYGLSVKIWGWFLEGVGLADDDLLCAEVDIDL